jgi:hypothetical protein
MISMDSVDSKIYHLLFSNLARQYLQKIPVYTYGMEAQVEIQHLLSVNCHRSRDVSSDLKDLFSKSCDAGTERIPNSQK